MKSGDQQINVASDEGLLSRESFLREHVGLETSHATMIVVAC
jgi:hypothetical protein